MVGCLLDCLWFGLLVSCIACAGFVGLFNCVRLGTYVFIVRLGVVLICGFGVYAG